MQKLTETGVSVSVVAADRLKNRTLTPKFFRRSAVCCKENADAGFRQFLHDGFLEGTAYPVASVKFNSAVVAPLFATAPKFEALSKANLEVRFVGDYKLDDGRFANNGWLHELPDPITKISWDNAILISPRLARELQIYPKGSPTQVARVESAGFSSGQGSGLRW